MDRRTGVRTFRSPRGFFTLTHATYRWENHLDQSEQLGYFNDAFQCLKKVREFRRGFGRNQDSSHKLQDVLGFIHTDIACSCKEGKRYFASVEKGGSAAWLPRPKSPKSTGEPAPTDGEDASPGDTPLGGVSSGKCVDLPLRQAQGGGGNAEADASPRHNSDRGVNNDMINRTGNRDSPGA